MKHFFASLFGLVLAAGSCWADERPNIVFAIADDWGWPHTSTYGNDEICQTPVFDGIAAGGLLFNHAYVSSPSCTPSRNAILTGQFHWRLGSGANLWSTNARRSPHLTILCEIWQPFAYVRAKKRLPW